MKSMRFTCTAILAALLLLTVSCADKARQAQGVMDTPEHHFNTGLAALDSGNADLADKEFGLALELDDGFGPAKCGRAVVMAMRGQDADDVMDLLKEGYKDCDGDAQEMQALQLEIRGYTALLKSGGIDEDKCLKLSRAAFRKGRILDDKNPGLYFYYGEAALQSLDFDLAEDNFAQVLRLHESPFKEKANARWELCQKAQRAAPETHLGKKIVLVEELSRADMAGVLVEELNVRRFYDKTQPVEKAEFMTPEQADREKNKLNVPPADIDTHPLKGDIETVAALGVQGLQPYPDGRFKPDEPMSRAELCYVLQDIIVRARNEPGLATEFIGQTPSPFADVNPVSPTYNAVMVCTTRGLLAADKDKGLFRPLDPIPGVDAMLTIRELKRTLNPF